MVETVQGANSAWNERMRLIRLRRKKERPRFLQELRIIPKWLIWTLVTLFILAQAIGLLINLSGATNNGQMFPPDLASHPVFASLALAGIITLVAIGLSSIFLMLGYVYRDAKRRDMNPALWTLLVAVLSPSSGFIGLIIYLLVREPLSYPCPQCSQLVGPRFNFCPNCKCNLRPACPNCKREIAETDKFCPYCAQDLGSPTPTLPASSSGDAAVPNP
jgi:multisubunit Na+/H+ antiporter MnhC subunit/RNA polymerase subunit RPABC4/transcription elongation factor Spt4